MMPGVKKQYITPSLIINNKKKNGYTYSGALSHLGRTKDFKPYTWTKEPEFVFAAAAAVGKGALIVIRTIIHHSTKQTTASSPEFHPVSGSPEYVVLSNINVGKYGLSRVSKYQTIKILDALNFIELYPRAGSKGSPIAKIAAGILDYQDIITDKDLAKQLVRKAIRLRKELK